MLFINIPKTVPFYFNYMLKLFKYSLLNIPFRFFSKVSMLVVLYLKVIAKKNKRTTKIAKQPLNWRLF